ncbi:short-chain alcohol dehydrogenase [Cytospora paraplurivora]|uniref:Short-chain alcohol dehydrogenase n=1 Tax=Cytospora paraplurivora TaxID=2898453 RepID=A0AAN9U4S5_9PEZI
MAPGPSFASFWAHFFPQKPKFTDKDLPDLFGKVYIVTGSNTGLGKEVARILYDKNAKVYIAARSEEKAKQAIEEIQKKSPSSKGSLLFLHLDLNDLEKTKAAAEEFLGKEKKLHVLFNNAGVMVTPAEPPPKTAQGYELSIGVNNVATFLFTKLLTPTLVATAKTEPPNTVRVVWLTSFGLELYAHEGVGLPTDNLDYHTPKPATDRYGLSKVGVWALGVEFSRRFKGDGIVSVPINPGNLKTELARDQGLKLRLIAGLFCYPVPNGASTAIFAGLSPSISTDTDFTENWVIPFGRIQPLRPDLPKAAKLEDEGGTGGAQKFWEWNEEQVKKYL